MDFACKLRVQGLGFWDLGLGLRFTRDNPIGDIFFFTTNHGKAFGVGFRVSVSTDLCRVPGRISWKLDGRPRQQGYRENKSCTWLIFEELQKRKYKFVLPELLLAIMAMFRDELEPLNPKPSNKHTNPGYK